MSESQYLTILQARVALPDPHVLSDARDGLNLLAAVCDTLVRYAGPERFAPALATSWHLESDARTWTFSVRPDARCHNGDLLTATDVVASIERARSPELGGSFGTEGVFRSYVAGASLEAIDDGTVRIVTAEPCADLLDLLVTLPIVPRRTLDWLPDQVIGSGPFRVVEATPDLLVMEAFDGGWHGRPMARRLRWVREPDHGRRLARVVAGEGDLATKLTPAAVRQLRDWGAARLGTAPDTTCVIFLCNEGCNEGEGPCRDRRVRQALNYAVDAERMIAALFDGAAERLRGPFTAQHRAFDPASLPYAHDPARARALLAEAGYPDGLALSVDIPMSMPDEAREVAGFLAEDCARAGIRLAVREHEDRAAYAQMVRAKRFGDLCLFDSSPASSYRVLREKLHSGVRGPWWQGYANPEVDRLIDAASACPDETDRQRLVRRATALVRDDAPWVFLYAPSLAWALGPRLAGWAPGSDGVARFG